MRVAELPKTTDTDYGLFGSGHMVPGYESVAVPHEQLFGLGQEASGGGTPQVVSKPPTFGELVIAVGLVAGLVFLTQVAMGFGTQIAPINVRLRGGTAGLGARRRR